MRNKIKSAAALSVLGFIIGYILTNSVKFDICVANATITEAGCINFYERFGDPLFYGMGALTLVFLVLLFVPKAYSAWKKFAVWFIPLAALVFIFYPDPGAGDYLSPYPEQIFQWVSAFYVVVSVTIISWASLRKPQK